MSCAVTNVGVRRGTEVVQLYVTYPESAGEPPQQLKAFQSVALAPGQNMTLRFAPTTEALAVWDVGQEAFVVPRGTYRLMVGASSEDIRSRAQATIG